MARLLYFAAWVKRVSRDPNTWRRPPMSAIARCSWLRGRGGECGVAFQNDNPRVIIHKHFATLAPAVTDTAELAFILLRI